MTRPIDRDRLRAELIRAGRLLTEPLTVPNANAYRVGGLGMLLLSIASECDMPDVRAEISDMLRAEHERAMAGYRKADAKLAEALS